ncbi:hypothetical protein MLD38_016244 [Melastoma candidum]|uniref:Uncharacterized protein n=1 Tax=Melastoma candidum TaxID=119954 RepID=A0ACB9RJE2_9MYRT|nr:hypothetical protein MLD38_016244 [Melastoma candidum]
MAVSKHFFRGTLLPSAFRGNRASVQDEFICLVDENPYLRSERNVSTCQSNRPRHPGQEASAWTSPKGQSNRSRLFSVLCDFAHKLLSLFLNLGNKIVGLKISNVNSCI